MNSCSQTRGVVTSTRLSSILTSSLLLAPLLLGLRSVDAEAQLNQTGRWQGPYFLGAPYPADFLIGAHLALLKGPADSTRALLFGQNGAFGVWSFIPTTDLTVPKTKKFSPNPQDVIPDNQVNVHDLISPAKDLFCAGHASVNGRLVVVGGQYRAPVGLETPHEFNPFYTSPTHSDPLTGTPPWRDLATNARGRWYPSVTALSTGLLASSGTKFGYIWTFGGSTGALQNDVRWLGMGNTVEWSSPTTPPPPPPPNSPTERKDHSAIMHTHQNTQQGLLVYKQQVVVFGGQTGPDQTPPTLTVKSNQVWAQYLDASSDSTAYWQPYAAVPHPGVGLPPERSRHSAIYHVPGSGNSFMVVYGGRDQSGNALGDVWKFEFDHPNAASDQGTWTRLLENSDSGPGNRYGHTAIFDPGPDGSAAPRMLVFGGRTSSTSFPPANTVWSLNLTGTPSVWTPITPAGGPGQREGHSAIGDFYSDNTQQQHRFRMVVFGGHNGSQPLNDTWSFSRQVDEDIWTWEPAPLYEGYPPPPERWRHAASRDGLDRMVVFGGEGQSGLLNTLWSLDLGNIEEVGTTSLRWTETSVKNPLEAPAGRAGHTAVADSRAIVERYPETFDPAYGTIGAWTTRPSAALKQDQLYPFMFTLPSGNVLDAGPRSNTQVLNTSTWSWSGSLTVSSPDAGSAVMYRPGSVLRCGAIGADGIPTVTDTDTIRFSGVGDSNDGWRSVATLPAQRMFSRKFHNLTVLPTGDVLVTGGLSGENLASAEKTPQIWKQATGSWRDQDLALDLAVRNYHSAAILLSDGRILSTGGEKTAAQEANPDLGKATIFEPPYLFNAIGGYAERPVITKAPCRIRYGQEFFISIPDTAGMAGGTVCLIRPGAVTHSFNQDQRYVPLDMSVCASGLRLRAIVPADSGSAPPGDYLLFIVKRADPANNNNRVPSIGKWVRVGSTLPVGCDGTAPAQTTDFTVDVVWETGAMLYWTAPGNDGATGTAAGYDLRHSGQSPTEATFCAGTSVPTSPPQPAGSYEYLTVQPLTPCTEYYMAFKTRDESDMGRVANWSALSNVQQFTTPYPGICGGMRAREAPASLARAGGERQEAAPLGRVPSGGAILAAEMRLSSGSPVWSLYHLSAEETARLSGSDSATVIAQEPDESDGWRIRARLRPDGSSFSLRSGRRERRFLFLGDFGLALASRVVGAGAAGLGQDLEVVLAHHSRLGDVMAAVDAGNGDDLGLLPGDTLTLRYGPTTQTVEDAKGEFLRITAGGLLAQTAGRGLPGAPAPPLVLPTEFALYANQPNPFARLTTLRFAIPRGEHVRLEVFDVLGRRVRTLAEGPFEAGEHAVPWDGHDANGVSMSPGVYHARIQAGEFHAQRTMVLLPSAR